VLVPRRRRGLYVEGYLATGHLRCWVERMLVSYSCQSSYWRHCLLLILDLAIRNQAMAARLAWEPEVLEDPKLPVRLHHIKSRRLSCGRLDRIILYRARL